MKNIINIALIILVVFLFLKSCSENKERENLLNQLSNYEIGNKAFDIERKKDSSTIAQQGQTILTQNEAIKIGLLKLDGEIKKVQSQVNQTQKIKIENVPVPYVPGGFSDTTGWSLRIKNGEKSTELLDSLINNSVVVPQKFKLENKWYNLGGNVKKDGILIDSLSIENESSVTVGWKKTGFLNLKREPIVEIKNTNPYLQVTKMNNVVIKNKKGLFENKFFWVGVGLLGGFIILK